MSRLTIDLGTAGNPATGDSIRTAFNKVNTNFTELYAELGGDSLDAISFTNNTISTDITNANLILAGNGTGGVVIEDIEITGSTVNVLTTNNNLTLNTSGTGKVVINGLSFPTADGTAGQVLKTDGAGNLSFTAVDPGAITFVGDDSTGTAVNIGETFKIAGTQNITIAVSGDTLTITGPNLSSYLTNSTITVVGDDSTGVTLNSGETIKIAGAGSITTAVSGDTLTITGSASAQGITFVGDDSTGTQISDGETIKVAGTSNITTAVSGDTLTITGPNLTNYAQKSDTAMTMVGDDSTGTAITIGETFKIAGAGSVTTAVSGDTLTITGSANLGDLTVDGTTISSGSSNKITLNESVDITGTLQVNDINSADSSAIQINDSLNASGTITAATFVTHGTGGSITGVNTLQVNEISSADSTAIQVDDAINFAGAGTFHGSVRFNAGYTEKVNGLTSSTTITVNCALASVHTVYLETNSGFVISNLPTGGSVTLIITQDSTGSRTATFGTDTSTTVKFAGGTPALSTASNSIDVVTIFNDGTNYLGNIAKAYAA